MLMLQQLQLQTLTQHQARLHQTQAVLTVSHSLLLQVMVAPCSPQVQSC
jgi:hypothetical protein